MSVLKVATCNLNQWALDFDGNLERILCSIRLAKEQGATYRTGPELEVCGYGCEDHFLEPDTFYHCWESLIDLLQTNATDGILCDIGMPVLYASVRYNCRVFCLDRKIIGIRPKLFLADDGNYRETRWFTSWKQMSSVQEYVLPPALQLITGQSRVPFGIFAIATLDTVCASETCEELFTPNSPHIPLSLAGVEIIGNGSGSHHQLRKLHKRMDLIKGATAKSGGIYLYANQQGCDGGRLYYDGCACIIVNGEIVAQGKQFSVSDVEVVVAAVDLEDVRSYRGACSSRSEQASISPDAIKRIYVNFNMVPIFTTRVHPARICDVKYHTAEEEIAFGPACWLWDYLRRSGAGGYFLPLSGGADSASVACIVGVMCHLVTEAANNGDHRVQKDVQRIMGTSSSPYEIITASEFAQAIFHTTYMGTQNSSEATRKRATQLALEIGSYHINMTIDTMVKAVVSTFEIITGKRPRFNIHGGTNQEDLALQNIQARLRMVMAYLLAQLLPWVRSRSSFLLVLSSANVDEGLRGYMTKYDCSSADLNPIGAVSKGDLKRLLKWAGTAYSYPALLDIVNAPPSAELRPQAEETSAAEDGTEHSQLDEEDMGMTYEELGWFGRLRKIDRCGPLWMFEKLCSIWTELSPIVIAEKVKRFFVFYSINRHKMTTLTPSYHAEQYSPDDNRFDLRPFLYPTRWTRQFRAIDSKVAHVE